MRKKDENKLVEYNQALEDAPVPPTNYDKCPVLQLLFL